MVPFESNMQAYIPRFSTERIREIAKKLYGIEADVKLLTSDIDQNFHLKTSTGEQYVFKILNRKKELDFIEGQQSVLQHLNGDTPYSFQQIIPTLSAKNTGIIQDKENQSYHCWMVSYLPGTLLGNLRDHSDQLCYGLGRLLGYMDKSLELFEHPVFKRYFRWDLRNALDARPLLEYISSQRKRNIISHFLNQYESYVVPLLPDLKKGIIHNDANDFNVIVDTEHDQVTGIIDFGDMIYTEIINELGVALAYIMMHKDDPLVPAISVVASYNKIFPLHEKELKVLFHLIATRLCLSVIISANDSRQNPDNEYLTASEQPAWDLLDKLVGIDPFRAENLFRNACEMDSKTRPGRSRSDILKARVNVLGKSLSVSYDSPLKIVKGQYQYLFDENGRTYLDTVNNVCHIGHCHPRTIEAARQQSSVLNTNTRYLHDNIIEYAEKLTATLPDPLNVCFFTNSGSEANELALRMAKAYSGGTDMIAIDHAYHGNTGAVIDVSPYKFNGPGGTGCPEHTHVVPVPDVYRGGKKDYAGLVNTAIQDIEENGRMLAGFIAESVSGVAGQIFWPVGYLGDAFDYVRKSGGVCIADEVQVGFGRVGTHMWGFETQNVVPDIVTLGKPIGNGHPIGAVITIKEIADTFNNGMEYFNTYGGNPVSCAVGLAVLEVIEKEGLQQHALEVGDYFKQSLDLLKSQFELIGDVRGSGLFLGIELITDSNNLEPAVKEAAMISERMKDEGILTSVDGYLHNVIKIKPPMPFSKQNVDQYIASLEGILNKIS
jgi:4-aminobutyrate aminotransferase-like enzyme/Ser/Thr protein kinase RdoA (MazF antagonist)